MNDKEEKDYFREKRIAKELVVGLFGVFIIFLGMFGLIEMVGKINDVENESEQSKLELIAKELDISTKDIVLDSETSDFYTAYTSAGDYKVVFDYSTDKYTLKSIVKENN